MGGERGNEGAELAERWGRANLRQQTRLPIGNHLEKIHHEGFDREGVLALH